MAEKKMSALERSMHRSFARLQAKGKIAVPDPATPIEIDPDALLTLVCWGDPQISSFSPLRTARFSAACADIANIDGAVDAILLAGDLCEFGAGREFRMLHAALTEISGHWRRILAVPGNHDLRVRHYHKQMRKFFRFLESLPNSAAPADRLNYYYKAEINGFTFLMLGSDRSTFEAAYLSDAQLQRLDADLTAAEAAGKPVFVMNHQTLKRMNGLPVTWLGKGSWRGSVGRESDKLRAVLEKHRGVVFITGHLHYGVSKYNYEDHGAFKALSLPTVGVLNHGAFSHNSQGYVITVYPDRMVFRARLFGKGQYVDPAVDNAEIVWRYAEELAAD